jgi:NADH-quinone oxidoreductase subunit H
MNGQSMLPDLAVTLVFIAYAMVMLLSFGGLLTWVERKQAAMVSPRPPPLSCPSVRVSIRPATD